MWGRSGGQNGEGSGEHADAGHRRAAASAAVDAVTGAEAAAQPRQSSRIRWESVAPFVLAGAFFSTIALIGAFRSESVPSWAKWLMAAVLAAAVGASLLAALRKLADTFDELAWVKRWLNAAALVVVASVLVVPTALLTERELIVGFKLLAVLLLATLPGFLYLRFLAVRGPTLWDDFAINVRRLKIRHYGTLPDGQPADDPDNLLVRKFQAVYGQVPKRTEQSSLPVQHGDTMAPLLLLTVLTALGWVAVLQPEAVWAFKPLPDGLALAGRPALSTDALRFGFIGSYFFIIQMLVRRYFQKDLKADAFLSAIVRIVSVTVIVAVMHALWPQGWGVRAGYGMAFFVGIFPQLGIEVIRAGINRGLTAGEKALVPALDAKYPLSEIDGLNLFHESRLLEEGIEDMQNLATADFVDLMLHTRIPIGRLVDWVDQAHLFVHLPASDEEARHGLRARGVRCATDLEEACRAADAANPPCAPELLATLRREPNMAHVRAWKGRR